MQRKTITWIGLAVASAVVVLLVGQSRPARDERREVAAKESVAPPIPETPVVLPKARRPGGDDTSLRARSDTNRRTKKKIAAFSRSPELEDLTRQGARLDAFIKSSSEKFEMSGGQYRLVPRLRAIPETKYSASDGEALQTDGGHVFYEVGSGVSPRDAARPVVYDERANSLGVLTGALSVKYSTPADAQSIAQDYGLKTLQTFDQIGTTFYQSSKAQASELLQLLSRLQRDKRVLSVSLHILEHTVRPQ